MRFFFYEIVARIVAIYLCVDGIRTLQAGLAERKIRWLGNGDLLDWLLDWSTRPVFDRDTAPVRYWMAMSGHATAFIACLVIAIFGWWQPNA
jgi:hypothetical protein